VAREICDRVGVIEAGRVIEQGSVFEVFTRPRTAPTRQLLRGILPALPPFLRERLLPAPRGSSEVILRLQFAGQAALEPVVADLARLHDLPVSVIHGAIDYIQEQPAGVLFLALRPQGPAQLGRAVDYLRSRVLEVEVMGYVPRAA
jgi:D-methionine transport system ATP-binding protein